MSPIAPRNLAKVFLLSVFLSRHVFAATTLYIPGFDPQPVTAQELGVGSDGQTTWLIAPGTPSGTLDQVGMDGPATLISGPNSAEVIDNDPDVGVDLTEDCSITDGIAVCTAVVVMAATDGIQGLTSTTVVTETASGFQVQGSGSGIPVSTSAPSATDSPSSGSPATVTPAPSSPSGAGQSGAPSSPAASSSGGSTTTSANHSANGATKTGSATFLSLLVTGAAYYMWL